MANRIVARGRPLRGKTGATAAAAALFLVLPLLAGAQDYEAGPATEAAPAGNLPPNAALQRSEEERVAESVAAFLRAARAVIASNQDIINEPTARDKGLTGEAVVRQVVETYRETTGVDPLSTDPASLEGRLLRAQMAAVEEVMNENQATINNPSLGFKGFVPAVFARLVNERFMAKVGDEAEVKVTAPAVLVRNRKALPDDWETAVIETRLLSSEWPEGQPFAEWTERNGRRAYRVIVPEYYSEGCLSCHGEPSGEMDITGYPKEGGKLGDLGGAISITLFR